MSSLGLSAAKLALLEQMLEEEGLAAPEASGAIPRQPMGAPPAVSPGQLRLWLLDRLEPESAAYNLATATELAGPLAVPALAAALDLVVRRHEVLRTILPEGQEEGPAPRIVPRIRLPLPVVDLGTLPESRGAAERDRLAAAEARRPFDLARGPVLRALLLRRHPGEHLLLLTLHHIAADGWSLGVLFSELSAAYPAGIAGRAPELPPLPIQYADYAAWQNEQLRGAEAAESLRYWTERLEGVPRLELPADRPRAAALDPGGESLPVAFPPALLAGTRALAAAASATPFMVVLAAFQALLSRLSAQDDVLVGTAVANRERSEVQGAIGYFANTLALRTDLADAGSFRRLLERVRETVLGAQAHQEIPWERVVAELQPARSGAREPLLQVLLSWQPPLPEHALPGLRLRPVFLPSGGAKFDLTLALAEVQGRLAGSLEYRTGLFSAPQAARLVHGLEILLGAALAAPEGRLEALPLLTPAERQQLLAEWNDTEAPFPADSTVERVFAAQAERAPDRPALAFGDQVLSYGELDRRAGRLARRLRGLGIGPEARVALLARRSLEMVMAMLAVLKAGGAYLPLDPDAPPERLAFQLEDSGARLVLGDADLLARMADSDLPALPLAEAFGEGSLPPGRGGGRGWGEDRRGVVAPENLAYVIYTSGSTGRPKGVAVSHRNALRLLMGRTYVALGPEDVVLQLTAVTFDPSVFEIWGPLLHGGLLAVAPPGRVSVEDLSALLARHGVSTLWLSAGLFHQAVEHGLDGLAPVRQLLAGGDAVSPEWARRYLARFPESRLINGYGPTEVTIFACYGISPPGDTLDIGRPLDNTHAFVANAAGTALESLPVGAAGELLLGGAGVTRGYLGRPDLTAERFVPDPWSGDLGARLYKTGDRVRQLADGRIEFLGRIDRQVKVRGVRVEPAEVESALGSHPGVRQCAVVALPDPSGDRRLVAYVVPAPGRPAPTSAELRAFLRQSLPEAFVPSLFEEIPALPLTPHGKPDRAALPAPRIERAEGRPAARPQSPTEELVLGLLGDLLGRPEVAPEDDFFELGGHSLLALRLVSRLRAELGVELPLAAVFEHSEAGAFARQVAARLGTQETSKLPPLVRRAALGLGGPVPLSTVQEQLWLVEQLTPGTPVHNIPLAADLTGELYPAALGRALSEVGRRHGSLRTAFAATPEGPVQRVLPFRTLPLSVVDLAGLPLEVGLAEASGQTRAFAARPFDLAAGQPWRSLLLRLAPSRHRLLVTLHHLVADGSSLAVLAREIGELYTGARVAELPVEYVDYALWERAEADGVRAESLLAAWAEHLRGAPADLALPADRPRPAVPSRRGGLAALTLPETAASPLLELGRKSGATPFMVLFAGFSALLSRYGGEEDLLLAVPVANRPLLELEGLIGLFVNVLALRADLAGRPGFAGLLRRSRTETLSGHAHSSVPFARLAARTSPDRPAGAPLAQAMLVFQEALPAPDLPGLTIEPVEAESGAARFDWTLGAARLAGSLDLRLEYSADLFDGVTAQRALAHFAQLLAGAVAEPERPIADLPFLAPAELQQVREWGRGEALEGTSACLHDLFAARVAETPDRVALVWEGESLSYGELARRSGALALRLRQEGIGPEVPVALALRRSPRLVEAMLAALQAGGTYVPIDPAYPAARVAFLLADSGARLLVTDGSLAPLDDATPEIRQLRLDREPIFSHQAFTGAAAPRSSVLPGDLAYLIFTSGSTGRPKAVGIEHASASALAAWSEEVFPAIDLEGVLAATSVSFDLSVFEILVTLCRGGRVMLAQDVLALPGQPWRDAVTLINTVPSALAALLPGGLPPSVRTVNLAGEPLPADLAAAVERLPGAPRLLNLYGPSEDTTYSTWARVLPGRPPAIGRPIDGTRAHVVDPSFSPQPAGVPGELLLGGAGLARGYLGRPDLTAERFVPDPWGEPGARLYRTGDRVRFLPDGDLDFLGRFDHQVKVRGVRIELGEVEAALRRHPRVTEAAALVAGSRPLESRLVAWVALADGGEAGDLASELRDFLRRDLPEAYIPSAIAVLPALPRTATGKLDRRALAQELPRPEAPTSGSEPARTPLEEALCALFQEVLGVERAGRDDDFFALGGHSLLAARLAARLGSDLGIDVPLRLLFESRTPAALAVRLESFGAAETAPPLVPIPRTEPRSPSFAQERLWLLSQLDPAGNAFNLPVAVRLSGSLDRRALAEAWTAVFARHEALRTRLVPQGGLPFLAVDPPAPRSLSLGDLSALPEERREAEAERAVAESVLAPFDLAAAPPVRGLLLRLTEREHRLALTIHHLATDGWSNALLVSDLAALYRENAGRAPALLPALPIQYADYAAWQRSRLAGAYLDRQIAHWRERLAGAPTVLDLPADRPRPERPDLRCETLARPLGASTLAALSALGREEGATLFMTLFAALSVLLSRLSGQSDLLVGTPVANRRRPELERVVGLFVDTLVLRADLAGEPSFRDLLGRARETCLGAFTHADLPFARLVEELRLPRDLRRAPLFQVMLNLLSFPLSEADLPDLAWEPLVPPAPATDLDLLFAGRPTPEEGLEIELVYRTELYDRSRAEEMLDQFLAVLEQAAQDPDQPVTRLSLLTSAGRAVLPDPTADLGSRPGAGTTEEAVFLACRRVAERTPERVALAGPERAWTYGEVEALSNRLAHRLAAGGVQPGDRVAVHADPSAGLVIAVLGILKAGAAFALLDPAHPAPRLAASLHRAAPRGWIVLTGAGEPAPELATAAAEIPCRVTLESGAGLLADPDLLRFPETPPAVPVGPDDLAYVAFTSGSTGEPKAILGTHRPLSHFLDWYRERFGIREDDRFALLSGLGHDPLLRDLFGPLSAGARLALRPPGTLPGDLVAWLAREEVSVLHLTPATARLFAERAGALTLPSVRWVFFGGDLLTLGDVRRLRHLAPRAQVANFYGATETPQAMGCQLLTDSEIESTDERVPLGRGIDGVQLLVRNASGGLAGIGELGEIAVRTPYLSRGYLGDPGLTAERFVANPETGREEDRLYRTGDLGRYDLEGAVRFAGRADDQVKIRGHRVELAEVRAALASHPDVAQVEVVPQPAGPDGPQLVAYVVARPHRSPWYEGRRRHPLPNGLAVVHLNRGETDYLYREIFELQAYLRHGITIEEGDTILDVGANIGLFRLFAWQVAGRATIHSFEPNPAVYELLARNAALYAPEGKLFPFGLAQEAGITEFSFYPGFSLLSGLHVDPETEKRVLETFLRERQAAGEDLSDFLDRADDLLEQRLAVRRFPVELRTLSQVLAEEGIEKVDLLKVNVEKSELDVLLGAADADWPKIRQVVAEVDVAANLTPITDLLSGQGFEVAVYQDRWLRETELHYVYAARRSGARGLKSTPEAPGLKLQAGEPFLTATELRRHTAALLPEPMLPGAFVLLEKLPLTPNGKVDRRALPAPERASLGATSPYLAPRTATEAELAELWGQLLGVERPSVLDSFFELGGHSLSAARLLARVREVTGVELPLRDLFEAPTIAGMAERLEARREEGEGEPLPTIAIDPESRFLPFPLTDLQQAYWLGRTGAVELGGVATHVYFEVESPDLDVPRLERAWTRLVERHDMLRAIVLPDGRQQVLPSVPEYRIAIADRDSEALAAERERMSHQVLDPGRWPLFELRASRLAGSRIRLHVSFDFLIADAQSLRVLLFELGRLYRQPDLALPPLALTFRDYVLAESRLRDTPRYERSRAYWQERLADLPPAPELPFRAEAPAEGSTPRFTRLSGTLEAGRWSAFKERAAARGLSPSSALLAAFTAILRAWSKGPRFSLNLTLFQRLPLHPEVDRVVGDFTSVTLLAAEPPAAGESFAAVARSLQKRLWSDLDHRFYGGVEVLRDLQRQSGGPSALAPIVFTSTVGLDGADQEPFALGEVVYAISQTPQVLLDHQVTEQAGALAWNWDTVAGRFAPGVVEEAFAAYSALLGRLADEEASWEGSPAPLLPAAHLALQAEANATGWEIPAGLLHTPIALQARRTPEATAVLAAGVRLSYGELALRVNRLGRLLRDLGARPGRPVAIVMEKGWEQIVAALGILAAGAPYLPIAADLPPGRRDLLLARGEVEIAVTQPWLDASLDWPAGLRRVAIDGDLGAGYDGSDLPPLQAPSDLAYVIFTSGSTGEPKGVMIDHRGALNTVYDVNRRFGVGPGDRVLALSSLSFDLSVYDLFGVLAAGGAIVLPEPWAARDPSHWHRLMTEHRVTLWNSVPALLEIWVAYAAGAGLEAPPLRLALLSGDWIPVTLPDRLRRLAPAVRIVAMGGATEASIWSILYPIGDVDPAWRSIPYGRPMAGQSFHVLDDRLAPRPLWVPGQLYIGGVGVAQGYFRDEERTRASFLLGPGGERLYRTGDLGRWLPDGNIEFLGREDSQVKVQGHRIELGEIEAALAAHPRVRAAAVAAVPVGGGNVGASPHARRLVAFVVPAEEPAGSSGGGRAAEALDPSELPPGVLRDPVERATWQLSQPGRRPAEPGDGPALELPSPEPEAELKSLFARRRSERRFAARPLPAEAFGRFLGALRALPIAGSALPKYRYPSAGGLYPVQVYVALGPSAVPGVGAGIYYHDPGRNALIPVAPGAGIGAELHAPVNREIAEGAAFCLLLVGNLAAIEPLYGPVGRDFCLLEAGYMGQLLMEMAPSNGIGLCPVGALDFAPVRSLLRLSDKHVFLHALLGGSQLAPEEAEAAQPRESLDAELRSHLTRTLPDYMVPGSWVLLDRLPLSANGKVDRKALLALDRGSGPARPRVAPRNALETTLATLWAEALGAEEIGVDDNFFDLGGTSVHIVRVHACLREALGRDVPLVDLFRHPTVSALAAHLAAGEPSQEGTDSALAEEFRRRAAGRRAGRRGVRRPGTLPGENEEPEGEETG